MFLFRNIKRQSNLNVRTLFVHYLPELSNFNGLAPINFSAILLPFVVVK